MRVQDNHRQLFCMDLRYMSIWSFRTYVKILYSVLTNLDPNGPWKQNYCPSPTKNKYAHLKCRKWGLETPIHIKMQLISINIALTTTHINWHTVLVLGGSIILFLLLSLLGDCYRCSGKSVRIQPRITKNLKTYTRPDMVRIQNPPGKSTQSS